MKISKFGDKYFETDLNTHRQIKNLRQLQIQLKS